MECCARIHCWASVPTARARCTTTSAWLTIRTLLRELKATGSPGVLIAVRNSNGESGDVWGALDDALPQLDVNARAQEFVESIR